MAVNFNNYDIETFIDELVVYLKANLNTNITAMNTAKGDSLLSAIDSDAYFINTFHDSMQAYDDFIFIQELSDAVQGNGPETLDVYTYEVLIISSIRAEAKGLMSQRNYRYRKVLEATLKAGWNEINKRVKTEIVGKSIVETAINSVDINHSAASIQIEFEIS